MKKTCILALFAFTGSALFPQSGNQTFTSSGNFVVPAVAAFVTICDGISETCTEKHYGQGLSKSH